MQPLVDTLAGRFPHLTFRASTAFCWSPETQEVSYAARQHEVSTTWSLLHETSHALLGHASYKADFELLRLEIAAWEQAKVLAREFGIVIDEDHIQDCLDTYRDWIYARSICPRCNNKSLQQGDLQHYQCFNCHMRWKVTPSRFCRAYRATKAADTAMPLFHATHR